MQIANIHLSGIRCFEDTGLVRLSQGINIFVGPNNSGKSTILRGVLAFQGFDFVEDDLRANSENSFIRLNLKDVRQSDIVANKPAGSTGFVLDKVFRGSAPSTTTGIARVNPNQAAFSASRPAHAIVPFLAKRKAPTYEQNVTLSAQGAVTGTYQHLVARVDTLATAGHPVHDKFKTAVAEIIGIPITTKAAPSGKECGFYIDAQRFVALERMGDGVAELVAHIVELVLEERKVFVLEEPESFLHPRALKALLKLIREASEKNQFLIATHSNIVLRELAGCNAAKIFRVSRAGDDHWSASVLEQVPDTAAAHRDLLRELGYEFADFGLHEGWLFLEESSAETVVREVLIPYFAPSLAGRLRTFSAAGASNLEPSVSEFIRLVSFVHLQPAYADRMWVRGDDDEAGRKAVAALRTKYSYLDEAACRTFGKPAFEHYYPAPFASRVAGVLAIADKVEKRRAKSALLHDVLKWSAENADAQPQWQESAAEPISLLRQIECTLSPR